MIFVRRRSPDAVFAGTVWQISIGHMNADEFVEAVRVRALEGAVQSTLKNLKRPPGRRDSTIALSQWFHGLPPDDREAIEGVARLAASHAVLAVLSVIDGAAAIESGPGKGHLELHYVKGNERRLLNDPRQEPLNDKLH